MKRYLLATVITAAVGGICELILPDDSKIRPHMKFLTSLCILLTWILPLGTFFSSIGDYVGNLNGLDLLRGDWEDAGLPEYESEFQSALDRYAKEEADRSLTAAIVRKFGLPEGCCRAEVTFLADGTPSRVLISLSGKAILQSPYEITDYVVGLLGCPCDVAVE